MVASRETNLLYLLQNAVFARPHTPYAQLLRHAGCTYADLELQVARDGLDSTLESLRRAGVYLSHDEYKGKTPIQRGTLRLEVDPSDFANPLSPGVIAVSSSGSRSRGTLTYQSLDYHRYREVQDRIFLDELGIAARKHIRISSILPSTGSIRRQILLARRGNPVDKWFALGGSLLDSGHYQWLTRFYLFESRLLGVDAGAPEFLPRNDFSPVAKWIARRRAEGFECLLSTGVSNGVRVAAAATELGLDIHGSIFRVRGEALTEPKRSVMESAGARVYPGYTISELGRIGCACLQMTRGNCVHVYRDSVAVIVHRRPAPILGSDVNSLLFTTLLPFTPTIAINVEMDDSATLSAAQCGCALSALGLTQQLSGIYSFGKLTGQGMTLLGSDLLDILERRLPARFGGAPTDFQLVECDGPHQTEIELRVHPRLGVLSSEDVRAFFLSELKTVYGGSLSRRNWLHTGGIRVVFAEPHRTAIRDKVHPLHLVRIDDRSDSN
jgi:hypothetical protein